MIGEVVRVWKWVYDKEYSALGIVERVESPDFVFVCGDWYRARNDETHSFQIVGGYERYRVIREEMIDRMLQWIVEIKPFKTH